MYDGDPAMFPGGPYPPAAGRGCRILILAAAAIVMLAAALVTVVVAVFMLMSGRTVAGLQAQFTSIAGYCMPAASAQQASGTWSAQQVTNAATIIDVGRAAGVPPQGQVIAVAVAMQESGLQNVDHGDAAGPDSRGLFQQRPSKGWGTAAQVMYPPYAASRFYEALQAVHGWQSMPLTVAAQAVQHSANPGAYARWQAPAAALVARITATSPVPVLSGCGQGSPAAGTPARLKAVLAYARAALGTAYQYGGHCTNPHSPDMMLHCDCSSLVQQSFARAGLNLPRTAAQQYAWGLAGNAAVIPLHQARIGDVVYMPSDQGPDTIAHTGIVVDPAKMIMLDAYATGEPVRFDSYAPAHDHYHSHLLTVLRFLAAPHS